MTQWDSFFRDKCIEIFTTSDEVIDIGGSLRLKGKGGNKASTENEWLLSYVEKIDYKVLDPVPDYDPDIVGDIHKLPFENESKEAILCLAVLEHVENPLKAMEELHRVLKPGGKLLIYVPFLYYYHAHEGYYKDFWRFTQDTIKYMAHPFSKMEYIHVRDRIEMLVRLTPFGRFGLFTWAAQKLDTFFDKKPKVQVSGYYVYLVK